MTPFSARALDRGLSGVMVALMRFWEERLNGNLKAGELQDADPLMPDVFDQIIDRAVKALGDSSAGALIRQMLNGTARLLALTRSQSDRPPARVSR